MIRFPRPVLSYRGGAVFLIVFCAVTLRASVAHAQDASSVVINEVLYDAAGSDTGQEWIELFNAGSTNVVIEEWRIERGGTNFTSVFTFPSGTALAPGAFLLVGESSVTNADFIATLVFQNGGDATDGIRLVSAHGTVIDALLYDTPNSNSLPDESGNPGTSFAPDVSEGQSLARIPDGSDTHASSTDFRGVGTPTPRQANSTQSAITPVPSPSMSTPSIARSIVINEVLPDPVGDDAVGEFVELVNPSHETVELGGFTLDDMEGGGAPYMIPSGTTISAGGYQAFMRSETKLAFNNDGDTVRLLAADGTVLATTAYEDVPRAGTAWARRGSTYEWTLSPTPGSPNVFTPLPTPTLKSATGSTSSPRASSRVLTPTSASPLVRSSFSDVRGLAVGAPVQVEGIVSAPPDLLGADLFYIAGVTPSDAKAGLQIFVSAGEAPALVVSDRISVRGVRSSIQNEARIRAEAADIRKLGEASPPAPLDITTGSIGEVYEGALVRVTGEVLRLSGNAFTLNDGSGPLRILIKKTTGWERPSLRRGQRVTVIGIVSQSGETYRMLPRFAEDLRVTGSVAGSVADRQPDTDEDSSVLEDASAEDETEVTTENREDEADAETSESSSTTVAEASSHKRVSTPALLAWVAAGALGIFRLFVRRS